MDSALSIGEFFVMLEPVLKPLGRAYMRFTTETEQEEDGRWIVPAGTSFTPCPWLGH